MRICVGVGAALLVLLAGYVLSRPPLPEDLELTIEEKARKDGYLVERHEAITEDGFVLGLYRVYKTKGQPVLLLHGFGLSPESFIFNYHGKALAYNLADAGFDVWLGCNRGNLHSRKHLYLTEDQEEFWDWSANEMVHFDIPALVSQVLNLTECKKVQIVGHSQGGTITVAALALFPALRNKIAAVGMLAAPPGRIPELPFIIRMLSHRFTQKLLHLLGVHSVLHPPTLLAVKIAHYVPVLAPFLVTTAFDASLTGEDTSLSVISSARLMGGTSVKCLELVRQAAFNPTQTAPNLFNYGPTLNSLIYHSPEPPQYNYSAIGVPAAYFVGSADEFISDWEKDLMKSLLGPWSEVHSVHYTHDHMGLLLSGKPQYLQDLIGFLTNKTSN